MAQSTASHVQLEDMLQELEDDIIFGRLLPRERLVEDALMRRFGAKRYLVRQALAELERIGFAERARNRGATVREFTAEDVAQIYQVREILQREAAALIPLPADPALIARLRTIQERHSAAIEAGDLRAVRQHNGAFHQTLFAASGNPYLADTIAYFMWLASAMRAHPLASPQLIDRARDEHWQMIAALEAGDRARLIRLCVAHIQPSKNAYLEARRGLEAARLAPGSPAAPAREPIDQPAPRRRLPAMRGR